MTDPKPPSFMELAHEGRVALSEIDLWVEYWHIASGSPMGESVDLRDYLGMTEAQYGRWLKDGDQVLQEFLEEESV